MERDKRRDQVYGLVVRGATARERLVVLAALVLGTIGMALLLTELHASWAPWPDPGYLVGTAVGFAAQGLGLVNFWIVLWVLVDAVGVPLQLATGTLLFSAAIAASCSPSW